jgi:PhnB protein
LPAQSLTAEQALQATPRFASRIGDRIAAFHRHLRLRVNDDPLCPDLLYVPHLCERALMTAPNPPSQPIPTGQDGLIPHLVCGGCADAIEFYKKAFGATEICRMSMPGDDRIMHAQIEIGGRPLYLADDFPEFCEGKPSSPKALGGTPVTIHRYVEDCDAAIKRAEDAGGTVTMPATDMFWGDRYGVVTDPFGHSWAFATHIKDLTPDEMMQGAAAMFAQG